MASLSNNPLAVPPHQIPKIPREPYTGPDLFTYLPSELLVKIFSFLHAPGDRKWRDKRAFKAIHSLRHPKLCGAVREQMFKYMTLNFSYRGHLVNGAWVWETPKSIQFVEQEQDLRCFVTHVRVQIKPVPERRGKDQHLDPRRDLPMPARHHSSRYLVAWENRLIEGAPFAAISPTFGYVDEPNTTTTNPPDFTRENLGVDQDDLFYHLFGMPPSDAHHPNSVTFPNDVAQEPFVYHVLNSARHRLLPLLGKLNHMEAGLYPGVPSGWSKKDYDIMSQCGLAFATVLILKTAPLVKTTSLRLQGVPPPVYQMTNVFRGYPSPAGFLLRNITARLEHFGHFLTHFDLGIDNSLQAMPFTLPTQPNWPDQIPFWAALLEKLPNLTSLRLQDMREKFEPREEENLDLNMLFNVLTMRQVETLELVGWAVTPEIMTEKLLWSFPKLTFLDLELLDMRSNEADCWVKVLKRIKDYYSEIKFGPLIGLRHRLLDGKDKAAYVKGRVKKQKTTEEQVDDVWNKIVEGGRED